MYLYTLDMKMADELFTESRNINRLIIELKKSLK